MSRVVNWVNEHTFWAHAMQLTARIHKQREKSSANWLNTPKMSKTMGERAREEGRGIFGGHEDAIWPRKLWPSHEAHFFIHALLNRNLCVASTFWGFRPSQGADKVSKSLWSECTFENRKRSLIARQLAPHNVNFEIQAQAVFTFSRLDFIFGRF